MDGVSTWIVGGLTVVSIALGSANTSSARNLKFVDAEGSRYVDAQSLRYVEVPHAKVEKRSHRYRAILQEITDAKATSSEPEMSLWLDQLGTLYAAKIRDAVWTNDEGYTARASKVIGELMRAEFWGLDASEFGVPQFGRDNLTNAKLAKMEVGLSLAAIKYAWHAHGGRIKPTDLSLWLDREIEPVDGVSLITALASAENPAEVFHSQHPQHPEFERLRRAYVALRNPVLSSTTVPEEIVVPSKGPRIRPGDSHRDVSIVRERLRVPASSGATRDVYTPELVEAVNKFMRSQGWKRKHILDNRVRQALNTPKRRAKRLSGKARENQLLVNIEKWRWVPRDLGALHIWNNLPEFETRVVRNNSVIHKERIIIGKTGSQTPLFSDQMTHIVFKPEWGIPNSIKIRSLLPRLASGDYDVLRRRGMSIKYDDGSIHNPRKINWSRTDIRNIPIVMGAGSSNPLGRMKFIFPNHHAVYMHDTPKKYLFKNATRTFSHGCIRVRDPIRLAEILLGETSGWNADQVARQIQQRGVNNNKVPLPEPIQVHNVYFTVVVDEETRELAYLKDMYGHDRRILAALNGTPAFEIAKSDPARAQQRKNEQLAKAPRFVNFRTASGEDGDFPPGVMALGAGYPPVWGQPKPNGPNPWENAKPQKEAKPVKYKRSRRLQRIWTNPLGSPF